MDETHGEGIMWKRSTIVLAVVLLLASAIFLFLQTAPATQQASRVLVPLESDPNRITSERQDLVEERDLLKAERTRFSEDNARLERQLTAARDEAEEARAGLEQSARDLAERDSTIEALSLERTNLMTRVTDLIAERQAVETRLEEVQQEKNQLVPVLEQIRGERDTMEAALSQAETQRDDLAAKVDELRGQVARFSLEAGELEDLGRSDAEAPQSQDPQEVESPKLAGRSSSELAQPSEQPRSGEVVARRWEIPLEKEALFAGDQGVADLEAAITLTKDGPSEVVSGVLEDGVEQYKQGQYEVAFETWYPLAEQGVRRAQFYIGSLFHEGRGVEQDQVKAFYWLSLSDKAGYPNAGSVLQTVEKVMTEAQVAAAHKLLDTAKN